MVKKNQELIHEKNLQLFRDVALQSYGFLRVIKNFSPESMLDWQEPDEEEVEILIKDGMFLYNYMMENDRPWGVQNMLENWIAFRRKMYGDTSVMMPEILYRVFVNVLGCLYGRLMQERFGLSMTATSTTV